MKDYLFVAPFLRPPGGGEGVANQMIQGLARRGSLTVLTWEPPDFGRIDEYYGTELCQWPFEHRLVAPTLRRALLSARIPHEMLKLSVLMGRAKRLRKDYRHCFAAYNDLDLGPGAINYLHYPCLDFRDLKSKPWPSHPLGKAIWPLYISACLWPARWSVEGIRQSVILANSHWSAQQYIDHYQAPVHRVLYPPALGQPRPHDGPRKEAFLSIGRVDRSKGWSRLVSVIEKVRQSGHEVELTLAGSRGDAKLLEELEALAATRPWLNLALDLPREELDRLIASHRFGLHGMIGEHYGMAVAELVLGGCLTLVHNSGGQVEIARHAAALYENEADAVDKIRALLEQPELALEVAKAQAEHRESLTRQAFVENFDRFLDELDAGPIEPHFGPHRPATAP